MDFILNLSATVHGLEIRAPTVRDCLEKNSASQEIATLFASTPEDYCIELDDLGINFNDLSRFSLFSILLEFKRLSGAPLESKQFPNFNINDFQFDAKQKAITWHGTILKESDFLDISNAIAEAYHRNVKFETHTPAGAKRCIEYHRYKRTKAKAGADSRETLLSYVVGFVNAPESSYKLNEVLELPFAQFMLFLKQVSHRIAYDNYAIGIFTGKISPKEKNIPKNWIGDLYAIN